MAVEESPSSSGGPPCVFEIGPEELDAVDVEDVEDEERCSCPRRATFWTVEPPQAGEGVTPFCSTVFEIVPKELISAVDVEDEEDEER
eukprot:CAMPEP_0171766922 /NCGR_PEP_ID=MMETSP0991-20121206/51536_1 /TAXON_ID=483369 /ORGANISM="non described non described, Strain CCMP2098" /LENGTH=87 /DNA_ID=CAMNT_0012371661 /DNA_START=581 /DNA_END=841 /DNA_ORIENTATION=+